MHAVSLIPSAGPRPVAPENLRVAARRCRVGEVDLLWIATQLGLANRNRRTIIAKLRLLVASGLPLPKNPRFVKGERQLGADAIDAHSIWDRDAVERWLENDRPPAESPALTVARRTDVAEQMRSRALQLVA